MTKPVLPKGKVDGGLMLPRWAVPLVWSVIVLAIHFLLPWAFARLGPRYGWSGSSPSRWNFTGLIPVAAGLGLYFWCLAAHFQTYPAKLRMGFEPPHLVVAGPYRFSRNPMYLAALVAWLGWAVFYGSPAVLGGLALLWTGFALRVIPLEERQLQEKFGEEFLAYKRSVARWIGRPRSAE